MRHWFVRHGQSTANAGRWLAGHRDVPLTTEGRLQALILRGELDGIAPGRVVSSDLQRARETAALAWEGRNPRPVVAPELRERALGAWEGEFLDHLRASGRMETLLSWDRAPPGGESHRDLAIRALQFLMAHDDGVDTVWFGHGGWIRTVIGLVDGRIPTEIGGQRIANAKVIVRDVPAGTWAAILRRNGLPVAPGDPVR